MPAAPVRGAAALVVPQAENIKARGKMQINNLHKNTFVMYNSFF